VDKQDVLTVEAVPVEDVKKDFRRDSRKEKPDPAPVEKSGKACDNLKAASTTVAGAGVGVLVGIAGIVYCAAMPEVLVPVGLVLWATGLAGGAMGLFAGIRNRTK
jgi:hypothetical protein